MTASRAIAIDKLKDFFMQDEGNIFLLFPQTAAAQRWVEESLPDSTLTFGNGYVIEHRYVSDIIDGILGDGYTIASR